MKLLVAVFCAAFSFYSIVRYLGLQTYAWDMGVYNQALYSTFFGGKPFYYTPDLPANPTGSLLGIHFSPALLALAPFYFLFPSPITLLVVQAVALGLGALPLYYYAVDRLGERRTPAIFAGAYLVSPLIVGIMWFDFHPETFLPPALLGAIYFCSKGRWLAYFSCIIVALASIETAPVIVGALALYFAWSERSTILSTRHLRDLSKHAVWVPLTTLALSATWLVLALSVIRAVNPINVFYYGGSPLYWTVLGARNISEVPFRVLTNPIAALSALYYDWWIKAAFLVLLFGPLVFLPLRSRSVTLLTVPWLGVALVSNYQPFYLPGFQYTSFVAPFIFVGGVEGFRKIGISGRHLRFSPAGLKRGIFVLSLVGFIVGSPIVLWSLGLIPPPPPYRVFSPDSHEAMVRELVSLVPPNASVLTQPNIFPLVSSRVNAYVVPLTSLFPPGTSFNATFTQWLSKSDYVLLDPVTDQVSTLLTLPRLRQLGSHGLLAQVGDVMLFKKSYSGTPVRFEPATLVLDWKTLRLLNARVVYDAASASGNVLYHDPRNPASMWNSSDVWLPTGTYHATFRFRTDANWTGKLVRINLSTYSVSVVLTPIGDSKTGFNYQFSIHKEIEKLSPTVFTDQNTTTAPGYRDVTISFVADGLESVAFVGEALTNTAGIYLDRITVNQTAASV